MTTTTVSTRCSGSIVDTADVPARDNTGEAPVESAFGAALNNCMDCAVESKPNKKTSKEGEGEESKDFQILSNVFIPNSEFATESLKQANSILPDGTILFTSPDEPNFETPALAQFSYLLSNINHKPDALVNNSTEGCETINTENDMQLQASVSENPAELLKALTGEIAETKSGMKQSTPFLSKTSKNIEADITEKAQSDINSKPESTNHLLQSLENETQSKAQDETVQNISLESENKLTVKSENKTPVDTAKITIKSAGKQTVKDTAKAEQIISAAAGSNKNESVFVSMSAAKSSAETEKLTSPNKNSKSVTEAKSDEYYSPEKVNEDNIRPAAQKNTSGSENSTENHKDNNPKQSELKFKNEIKISTVGYTSKGEAVTTISEPTQSVDYGTFKDVQIKELTNTVSGIVKNMPENTTGTARIIIKPEQLGTVFVEINLSKQKVNLNIRAENSETVRLIESQITSLKDKLRDAGLDAERIDVSHKENDSRSGSESKNQTDGRQRREDTQTRKAYLQYLANNAAYYSDNIGNN